MRFFVIFLCITLPLFAGTSFASPPEKAAEIIKHLEFLGYDVSLDSERITGTHSENFNIYVKKYRGGMLFTSFLLSTDYGKEHLDDFLPLVNKLNQKASAVRWYVDGDGDLIIEGYYPGEYEKQAFSTFLDAYNLASVEIGEILEEISKFLK